MNIVPARLRELAGGLRWRAGFIAVKKPVAKTEREATRQGAIHPKSFARAEEVLQAMDKVVQYHVDRLQAVATTLDTSAREYEEKDQGFADDLKKAMPR
ncbi:type VII secretion target [Nocardia neocaledoniensis]|uniref:type VII secretion target n=1 Tax=Nocardia neocaledoniensis TaxID=236511 RepID=UPI0033DD47C0